MDYGIPFRLKSLRQGVTNMLQSRENSRLHEIIEIKQHILQTIEHHKLKWYGNVHKMNYDSLPKVIIDWNRNEK